MAVVLPYDRWFVNPDFHARIHADTRPGWFILLTSLLSFWRVKRWERGILASQPPSTLPAPGSGDEAMDIVSGVVAALDAGVAPLLVSAFTRILSAWSKTSWVMIASVWTRRRVCGGWSA